MIGAAPDARHRPPRPDRRSRPEAGTDRTHDRSRDDDAAEVRTLRTGRAVGAFRRRFQAWVDARQPATDTLLLTQRNVYILPTPAGWMYAATLAVLLLASINYQLNLGYLLTFLLAGSGLVSMHLTHATLRGLTLHLKPVDPVYVGEPAMLDLVLTSPSAGRHGVGLRRVGASDAPIWLDVPARGQAQTRLAVLAPARGRQPAPPLVAETRFPFGLFRAWAPWRPATAWLVYPRPEHPPAPLPAADPLPGGPGRPRRSPSGEIDGVRAYRRGDPMRQIAWKKAARSFETGGELVSRESATPAQRELRLDWNICGSLPAEARLSRLAAWVLVAERSGRSWSLGLPAVEIGAGGGDGQRRRCLEALAAFEVGVQLPRGETGR